MQYDLLFTGNIYANKKPAPDEAGPPLYETYTI